MATYAVGDVQGCYLTLRRLLRQVGFRVSRDKLWFVGDLVNRGPRSLAVLRFVRGLGNGHVTVLGNHDLHLIGRALGLRPEKRRDTLDEVLAARDCDSLIDWLRARPMLHHDGDRLLVHAGLHPAWTPAQAAALAREVEQALRGDDVEDAIEALREDAPRWSPNLTRKGRLRIAIQTFAVMRTCKKSGRSCWGYSGPPEHAPRGCQPWFEVPGRRSRRVTVITGHWAALGLRLQPGVMALDSGCVWGRRLTAIRLDDRAVYQEPMAD
ncbi:MAG: symmetrical bis(5'-nucleosyl)-tetraphosphatase [Vicinamibacteria bacterium]